MSYARSIVALTVLSKEELTGRLNPLLPEKIAWVIKNLPCKKVSGYDISNGATKNFPVTYYTLLSNLINAIFKFRHFLSFWKHANITPIRKPGEDLAVARSYRQVSLLPAFGKITEHIFLLRLQRLYTDMPQQFGFRPKHSTSHQQLQVIVYIYDAFDNFELVGALFLDVAKAFDTVWHSGLVYKKIKMKFPTTYVQFIRSRTFTVRITDKHSTCRQINTGVPIKVRTLVIKNLHS